MIEKRFVDHDTSVEDYVRSLENKNTKEKTKRDVKLLEKILRNENSNEREVPNIDSVELNKYLADFIRSVRRKDGEDNKPSSLPLTTTNNNLNLSMYMIQYNMESALYSTYINTVRAHFTWSILYTLDQQLLVLWHNFIKVRKQKDKKPK